MYVYGIHSVLESIRADRESVQRLIVARGKSGRRLQEVIDLARREKIPIHFEPDSALDRKASTHRHQGVIAETSSVSFTPLDEILAQEPKLLLLLDGIEDPRNLGAVLRSAEAAGVEGILLPDRHCCGLTSTVIHTSAGAALHLKICQVGNVAQLIERLKDAGFWSVGLDLEGREGVDHIDTDLPLLVVVGAEGKGLRRLTRERCDFLVRLPMLGRVESLNLSVAAGILLYLLRFKSA